MIRIVRGSPATLSATFYVDETGTALDDVPTVTVTRVGGSQVATGAATSAGGGTYTYTLPPQADLAVLSASWTGERDGQAVSVDTYAEVVGSEYFSISELRNSDSVLQNTTKYPTSKLISTRLAVESEFEGICGRSFVPRYAREVLYGDGTGTLWLSNPEPLRVISCTVDGEDWSDREFNRPDYNLRILTVNDARWHRKIVIEYEYGKPEVPVRIKEAAIKRAKYSLVSGQSRIDERATVMNIPEFGNFVLATPGVRGSYTGIPEVDVVLDDYVLGGW
jgi:hypothetical protein